MRLTHIKLAGFKSFVDATTIPVKGQLVGVVGPNGCGKSNIIDAVRWVLGESSARHLRGDSMQDVIFNGSSARSPVSRASVELTFDNQLGRANGQWAQYAGISVKRVVQRSGESSYYINNSHVRRRDVVDVFLGTGLGPRAYAIIEQGMISRIIDAKPEELRTFLEEAAGVSLYKERRKESENRLRDTRQNLARVADAQHELRQHLNRLESQAEVAAEYRRLQQAIAMAGHALTLVRKQSAAARWEKAQRDVERVVNLIEAETAALRRAESDLEHIRSEHHAASDAAHRAQGEMYAANADIARLEQEAAHRSDRKSQLQRQWDALNAQTEELRAAVEQTKQQRIALELDNAKADTARANAAAHLREISKQLPEVDKAFQEMRSVHEKRVSQQSALRQSLSIEETHVFHGRRSIEQARARIQRLEQERQRLAPIDQAALEQMRARERDLKTEIDKHQRALEALRDDLHTRRDASRRAQQRIETHVRESAGAEAERAALEKIQRPVSSESLAAWVKRVGLDDAQRLWQQLTIEPGWELTMETALEGRLDALAIASLDEMPADPPASLSLIERGQNNEMTAPESLGPFRPLASVIKAANGLASIQPWLAHHFIVDDMTQALAARDSLPEDAVALTREGHQITRHTLQLHGKSGDGGKLVRKRRIEQLDVQIGASNVALNTARDEQRNLNEAIVELEKSVRTLEHDLASARSAEHALTLEINQQRQRDEHIRRRQTELDRELRTLTESLENDETALEEADIARQQLEAELDALNQTLTTSAQHMAEAQQQLDALRRQIHDAEKEAREAEYRCRTVAQTLESLAQREATHAQALLRAEQNRQDVGEQLAAIDLAEVSRALEGAVAQRFTLEASLAEASRQLAEITHAMEKREADRLRAEQQLHPLRDKLERARLAEQEIRILFDQLNAQLKAADVDEAALANSLSSEDSETNINLRLADLQQALDALGAVNLAAFEELKAGREREAYVDAQLADLTDAIETLETAIQRIDRETRDRLQQTFDTVNRNFTALFQSVFGGGSANLALTGEEILDAGVAIHAQPPGKKNASIHLLSGGEKALTALSLVFALFQLNPAPFCLLDEVDAPLDDSNTERYCELVKKLAAHTQFIFVSHNKVAMEMGDELIGITMAEPGVSRVVSVDIESVGDFAAAI